LQENSSCFLWEQYKTHAAVLVLEIVLYNKVDKNKGFETQ